MRAQAAVDVHVPGEGPIPFTSQEKAPTASSSTMAQPSHIDVDALDDPSESEVEIVEKHWPNDYFTAEIAACLRECSSRTHRRSQAAATQHSVFNKHFPGVRFVSSTFGDHRDLWTKASSSLREEFLGLARTEEARWRHFAKRSRQEQRDKAQKAKSKKIV